MVQDTIKLPNTGCEYISHYYDDKMGKWIVLYEQKPGMHGQALVDTGVPKPVSGDNIKYVGLSPFAANIARKVPGKRLDGPLHGPVGSDNLDDLLKDNKTKGGKK